MEKPRVLAILGPTSVGKTSCAIDLAEQFGGEVVSADSRQVYRGLDLATGKVTPAETRDIPHHLLDIADPTEVYTASDFLRDATTAIDAIHGRGKLPVIAGGTNFYVDLLRGKQQPAPVAPDPALRATLAARSTADLFAELQARDPRRAANIETENRRRLIRALEIVEHLGAVPPAKPRGSQYHIHCIGLTLPFEQLTERINRRLEERLTAGLIAEIQAVHEQGVSWSRLEELGLEMRYAAAYLQGELHYEEFVTTLATKHRQFAKRQYTWLKRDPEITWFSPHDHDAIAAHAAHVLNGRRN